MTRFRPALAPAGIFAVALMVRLVAAIGLRFPVPEDTAYYVAVARNLLAGRGLVSDALWSYQTPPLEVPRAAFEVWLPLPSLLDAVPMAVLGRGFGAAQVASVLIGATVPVLAWLLARDVARELGLPPGRARTVSLGSGIVAAVLAPLVVHSTLPDSTMPFAALALAACLLMTRLGHRLDRPESGSHVPLRSRVGDPRLLGLGLLIGLAGLCRNEALWLGLTWAIVAWRFRGPSRRDRLLLVATPAVVAILVYLPWAVRDWLAFGTPLPGQGLGNALFVSNLDVFAYRDVPTLARYLAQGPTSLLAARLDGIVHNLANVLLVPGVPTGPIGLVALWPLRRLGSLRPLIAFGGLTFAVDSLVFPVATQWGTFLHAAAPIHVLLIVSSVVALDAGIAWLGRLRHWTRPVAWLGPAFAAVVALPVAGLSMASLETVATDAQARYQALPVALAGAGTPLSASTTVIADHPIWLADTAGIRAVALPDESAESTVDLARLFGARLVVVQTDDDRHWAAEVATGAAGRECFREVNLQGANQALAQTRVFEVVCQ